MAYDRLEPIGKERDDWNTAKICQTMANIHARAPKDKPYPLGDFLLRWDRGEEHKTHQQSVEEMYEIATAITEVLGGTVK